jgi:hypothetical protein
MNRPLQLLAGLIAVGVLALACVELAKLMDIGTCASGGPYVSANPCPEGTGTRVLLLTAGLVVYVIALMASGQGLFFYGLLFVALSATFIRGGITDNDFAGVGYSVGGLFAVMGLVPMFLAIRGWFSGDDESARSRASGIASFTQLAQRGVLAPAPMAFAGPVTPPPAPPRPTDDLARLQQLGDLHARGVLTDAEFATEKAKIINGD